jgi:hypothetical protein
MTDTIKVFSSKFKRQKTSEGRIQYQFEASYPKDMESHELAIDGDTIINESDKDINKMPEEIFNPSLTRKVFETWISDCSGSFVKSPTIEQCLSNVTNIVDSNAQIAQIMESEDESWIYLWVPTRIQVDMPRFYIYWAPSYKTKLTRIPDLGLVESNEYADVEINMPETTYIPTTDGTRLITTRDICQSSDWLQELSDSALPLSDSPTLRLNMELTEAEQVHREKYRRRVREARIRAKLSKYRAERLAERYEERFGVWPEEDEEEARTDVEGSDED